MAEVEPTEVPRPDPRLPLWNAIRAVIDLLIERGLDPAILGDQLILAGHAWAQPLGAEVERLLTVDGWTDPDPGRSPALGVDGDQHAFLHYTRRLVRLLVNAPSRTRVEVMAAQVDSDEPPLDLDAWLRLLQTVAAERAIRRARHPTPQGMVARPGAHQARRALSPDPPRLFGGPRLDILRIGAETRCEAEVHTYDQGHAILWWPDLEGLTIREADDGVELEGRNSDRVYRARLRDPVSPPIEGQPLARWRAQGGSWTEMSGSEVWTHIGPREGVEGAAIWNGPGVGADLPHADEPPDPEREARIRAALARLTDASVTREEAVERAVREIREASQRAPEPAAGTVDALTGELFRRQVEALATAPVDHSLTREQRLDEIRRQLEQIRADAVFTASNMASGGPMARPSTVEEVRALLDRVREAARMPSIPADWITTAVEAVQRAHRASRGLRLTGNTTIGIDHGTNPPSVFRANRSFTGGLGELHWNTGALERALGIEPFARARPTTEGLAGLFEPQLPPGEQREPRNRAERRARRRRRTGL